MSEVKLQIYKNERKNKKMKRILSMILAVAVILTVGTAAFAAEESEKILIDSAAKWSYLDDNTDPAGDSTAQDYDRTAWTLCGFDDSQWSAAAGPFGSKGDTANYDDTHTAKTVLHGCDGQNDTPTYFFRNTFTIDSLDGYTKLVGSVEYDDGAIVYINGQPVAAGHDIACDENGNPLGYGFDSNNQYGGSNQGPDTLEFEVVDLNILREGENVIAVELHNGRKTSSDVWFACGGLKLSTEKVIYQNNISLSVGADESQMNFAWYSQFDNPSITVSDNAELDNAAAFTATAAVANDGQYSCKATVSGLTPDSTYYYQLCNNGYKSDVYSFSTKSSDDFSFALVGDPQIGASGNVENDSNGWDNTLNILNDNELFNDISFLVSAGDQVNSAADENQYDGYLEHSVLTGLPVATTVGNHDSSSDAYSQHFNVPNESDIYGLTEAGGDYYFTYNNVLFMVLNSNNTSAVEHRDFMQETIEATSGKNIKWKIVVMHHTLFTVASHAHDSYIDSEKGFKAKMIPVFEQLGIDVVLQGHDHVYCRTYMMDGTTPITDSDKYEYGNGENAAPTAVTDPDGILYITANSGSGSKNYGILDETFDFSAAQSQNNSASISKISVTDTRFSITTYNADDMSVIDEFTIIHTVAAEPTAAKLLINQVYGGNAKGDTPIANSFIELYNPNDEAVDLSGYALRFNEKTLSLSGTIPTNGSYLIVGAAEATSDEYLTYDLPNADMTCDWAIDNKSYTITLENGEKIIDSVTAGGSDNTKISKQKSLLRIDHADTDSDADFMLVSWKSGEMTATADTLSQYAPHNSKGDYGKMHEVAPDIEPTYTPVVTSDTRVNGYYNENGSVKLELAGRYNSGAMNADGGSLEIVQYNPTNGFAYAVSGVKGKLIAVDLSGSLDGEMVVNLSGVEYDIKAMISGFEYGDMTSVAISPNGKYLAAAIQAEDYSKEGIAALFDCETDGTLTLIGTAQVGVQPDMITFADDNTILTADEGEPRNGINGIDPKGSVTVINIGDENILTAKTVYFDSFDEKRDELTASGVLIQKDTQPSTDFEPEYIAISGNAAYVSLQEANSIAVLDIANGEFTGVYPLGFQDYGKTSVDLQKNSEIKLEKYENVYGIKMPDGISVAEIDGNTYILTANEGDSRADWAGFDNEYENATSPSGNVTLDSKVVWFNAAMWDGLDENNAYVFGGRSFSIYEATDNGLSLVYDSGSDFEKITADVLPEYFNASNDKITLDNRSGKKGPEPETVVTGKMDGKTYAFIALERIGGVMVYDITDPQNAQFVNYINSREFDDAIMGDVSPEGLCFIPAADSKNGQNILLAACEVSGTLTAYSLDYNSTEPDPTDPANPTVPTVSCGDVNSDGKVNLLDLIAMRKHLAKWSISIDEAAADCNADGKVNLMDLILLRKYLAKWDVVLGPKN